MGWLLRLWQSTIGKKAVMAITGLMLFGFVVGHLAGNLQIFYRDGGKAINDYGKFLHDNATALWVARIGLLVAVGLHIATAIQLVVRNRQARPVAYVVKDNREASFASRTMKISGPLIALFVIYHLLHFTGGQAHPDFKSLDVHHNVVAGFRNVPASLVYIVAMLLLGGHLLHGLRSMFQSLGLNHPKYAPALKAFAVTFATLITAGNISIPIAVMIGVIK